MNDDQLKTAAYKYCEVMGINPDESTQSPSPSLNGITLTVFRTEPTWESVARMLRQHWAASLAIEHALKAE